jgi:predicted nucleic acid-binding protein
MGIIVDTSVIIAGEKGKINFATKIASEEAYISVITVTELVVGVELANTEERRIKRAAFVEHIITSIPIIPFNTEESRIYARILSNLLKEKITIGTHDLMIAATAITNGHSVLTMNERDFKRIKGLELILI